MIHHLKKILKNKKTIKSHGDKQGDTTIKNQQKSLEGIIEFQRFF